MNESHYNPEDAALETALTKACISYYSDTSPDTIGFAFKTYADALEASRVLKDLGCTIDDDVLQSDEEADEDKDAEENKPIYPALRCTMTPACRDKVLAVWNRVGEEHNKPYTKAESLDDAVFIAYLFLTGRLVPAYELEPSDHPFARAVAVHTTKDSAIAVVYSAQDRDFMQKAKEAFEGKYGILLKEVEHFGEDSCGFWLPKALRYNDQGREIIFIPPEVIALLGECKNHFLPYAEMGEITNIVDRINQVSGIVHAGRIRQAHNEFVSPDCPGFSYN